MKALAGLPSELVEHIVSFLAIIDAPSLQYLHEEPSPASLTSEYRPLKYLSSTSRILRQFCFSKLFSHLKVDVNCANTLLAFVHENDLAKHVDNVVVFTTESMAGTDTCQDHRGDMSHSSNTSLDLLLQRAVVSIVEHVNPSTLTIIAPPSRLASLVPHQIQLGDSWAFNIEYQTLRLEYERSTAKITTSETGPAFDIFSIRPWDHISYNEGCSVQAYSTYEYFHLRTPSLLGAFSYMTRQLPGDWLAHLTSFDFIAVFPFTHTGDFCAFLRRSVTLKRLRTRLAPSTNSNILDDPARMGTCQQSDLWAEFEGNHQYLLNFLYTRPPTSLIEYTTLDYTIPGLRSIIDRIEGRADERFGKCWGHDGNGRWLKTRQGHRVILQPTFF
jgi:hypothetical protein